MKTSGNKWMNLISGLLFIGLGATFFVNPGKAFDRLGILCGIILIVIGLVQFVLTYLAHKKGEKVLMRLIFGIVTAAFGVLLVTNLSIIRVAMLALFGIWAIVIGVIKGITAWQYKTDEVRGWFIPLAAAIFSTAFGVFALLGNQLAALAVAIITGIYLTIFGLYSLGDFFILQPKYHKAEGNRG